MPVKLAPPLEPVPSAVPMSRSMYGRIVAVVETERGRRTVRLALVDGGREELECEEGMAETAGRLFARKVKVRATGIWDGTTEHGWHLSQLQPWSDLDLVDSLLEVRRELDAEGVTIDVDRWLQEQD